MAQLTKEMKIEVNPFLRQIHQKNTTGGMPSVPASKSHSYRWVRVSLAGKEDNNNISKVISGYDQNLKARFVKVGEIDNMAAFEDKSSGLVRYKDVALVCFDKRMATFWDESQKEISRLQSSQLTEELTSRRDSTTGNSIFHVESPSDPQPVKFQ